MNRDTRFIVTGASGLLGRAVMRVFSRSYIVEGWANRRPANLEKVNLLDEKEVVAAFQNFRPRVLIHAAAERWPDAMERNREQAWALNVDVTENLAKLADSEGVFFFFISTDYVFDGLSPPYSEQDAPKPLNFYAESKVEAERRIGRLRSRTCILRIPILYGPSTDIEESSITVLLKSLRDPKGEEVFFDDRDIRYPTLTSDVAEAIGFLVEKSGAGIFHYTAEEPFTKYGMAVEIARQTGITEKRIYPDPNLRSGAGRPLNAHLNNTKIRRLGFDRYTRFHEGIASVLRAFR